MKQLTNFLKLGSALVAVALTGTAQLAAIYPQVELNASGGWRQDHLRSQITSNINDSKDIVKGSHLNIWQLGIDGYVAPQFFECDSFLNNFILQGSAYWGWVNNGIYQHKYSVPSEIFSTLNRGDISRGHTWDYTIGLGYLFPVGDCFRIGPTFGYAFNKLSYRAENVIGIVNTEAPANLINQTLVSATDPFSYFDEGLLFSSRWKGPWAGFDAQFDFCEVVLMFSYEYHWGEWLGKFTAQPADILDNIHYSDVRKSNHAHGHVGYVGANYIFSECFNLGLGVKYENFRASGKAVPRASGGFPAVGGPEGERNKFKTTWNTVQLFVDLGVLF